MGDTSVWFERGASYFDFARLMEDCTIGLASVDGVPAAVSCGAEHAVRVGGAMKQMVTVSHLRVLPEHQRKGLWGAANSVLDKYWPHVDGSAAYISVDNLAMQHGFADTPDKWPQVVRRVELDCAALAGPPAGRTAAPADADEIVRRLNAFHGSEELFVPYTEASFSARMSRAPDLYAWDKIWMTDGALVGVWAAGNALRHGHGDKGLAHRDGPGGRDRLCVRGRRRAGARGAAPRPVRIAGAGRNGHPGHLHLARRGRLGAAPRPGARDRRILHVDAGIPVPAGAERAASTRTRSTSEFPP